MDKPERIKKLGGKLTQINAMQEIIQLCLLSADSVFHTGIESNAKLNHSFECYFHDSSTLQEAGLFMQEDGKTPVVFAHMELVKKYATAAIFEKLFEEKSKFRVTQEEIRDWQGRKGRVADSAKERQKLHNEWAKTEKKQVWLDSVVNSCLTKEQCNELVSPL